MDILNIPRQEKGAEIKPGSILIAEPFLADGSFSRSVVLICEHGENGTIGFIINRLLPLNLTDLQPDSESSLSIFDGGPVERDTLHMLHRMPEELGGCEIYPGIYWGGSFDVLRDMITNASFNIDNVKLFAGYAGWSVGQLDQEMNQDSWYIGSINSKLLFDTGMPDIWRMAILELGDGFAPLVNMPLNPQLN